MRTLLAAVVVLVGLLFVGPADAAKKKAKSDDAALTKGRKRSADDPVLRRYGKKAQYVAVNNYTEKTKKPAKAEADEADEPKPMKAAKKLKAKPAKVVADEEILVIEETPAKKPAMTKAKKTKAKPAKVADDDEEIVVIEETPAKKKPAKKAKAKPVADDESFTIIEE